MKVLNFAHPITESQLTDLATLIHEDTEDLDVVDISVQIDFHRDIKEQIDQILNNCSVEWDAEDYVVRLPGMSFAAAMIVVEIYKRSEFFPQIAIFARDETSAVPAFYVKEVVDLEG
jgi:hypothetical protein